MVVDTNVPVVANGRGGPDEKASVPSISCRQAAVERLQRVLDCDLVLLDEDGQIQNEYQRYLQPSGQPGVGDQFYREIINSHPERVRRVALPKDKSGSYTDFPAVGSLAKFDRSDRKFAALARREHATVLNATDTDWLNFRVPLAAENIHVEFLCGCDPKHWFDAQPRAV